MARPLFLPRRLAGAYNFQSISAVGEKAVWPRETIKHLPPQLGGGPSSGGQSLHVDSRSKNPANGLIVIIIIIIIINGQKLLGSTRLSS